ncbi:hypothetical protein ACWEG1_26450 [Streptomyces bauhiniae]
MLIAALGGCSGDTGATHTSAGNQVRTVDDTWYRVPHPTYNDALAAHDRARLRFSPLSTGC